MRAARCMFWAALAAAALFAFLARRRSMETGEDYAAACRGVLADGLVAWRQTRERAATAVREGLQAARRREQEIDQDLAAASSPLA